MHEAFQIIPASTDISLFIFGDHASCRIPEDFGNLGLSGDNLTRHIAWDIGTDVVVETLCGVFGCAGQVANISRLLIDLNRDPRMPCVIPVESDGTLIPGNRAVSEAQKQERIDRFHTPYHAAINSSLDKLGSGLAISVHSFTPQLDLGQPREIDIGLLVKHDENSAKLFKTELERTAPDWRVKVNEPYSAHVLNYTIDTDVSSRGFPHLAIEINQAMIDNDDKARAIGLRLSEALRPVVESMKASVSA